MSVKKCVTMILAGGRGERLGSLTSFYSKPAVHFGGGNRIIDFTLRNCINSGMETIGILSQYFSTELHTYINAINNTCAGGGRFYMLPSRNNENLYMGTADAVSKNISFINGNHPDCVLILAGDHIYDMDYSELLEFHRSKNSAVTIAATTVPTSEASRFGILSADREGRILSFEEKPACPKGNTASMGIYVFDWDVLRDMLLSGGRERGVRNDLGRDIIPVMLNSGEPVYAFTFRGYWKDVGTLDSLWEANMRQIDNLEDMEPCALNISGLCSVDPCYNLADGAAIRRSIISGACSIFGRVEHSVLEDMVTVAPGAEVVNSVIMPHVYIGRNAKINNAIIGTNAVIADGAVIGTDDGTSFFADNKICMRGISLVSPWLGINSPLHVRGNSHITQKRLDEWYAEGTQAQITPSYRRPAMYPRTASSSRLYSSSKLFL